MPYDPNDPNDPRGPQGYPGYAQQAVAKQQQQPASGYQTGFMRMPSQDDPDDPRKDRQPFGSAEMPQAPQQPQAPQAPAQPQAQQPKGGIPQSSGYETPPYIPAQSGTAAPQQQETMPLGGIQGGPMPQYIALPQMAPQQGGGYVPPMPGGGESPKGQLPTDPYQSPPWSPLPSPEGGKQRPPLGPRTPQAGFAPQFPGQPQPKPGQQFPQPGQTPPTIPPTGVPPSKTMPPLGPRVPSVGGTGAMIQQPAAQQGSPPYVPPAGTITPGQPPPAPTGPQPVGIGTTPAGSPHPGPAGAPPPAAGAPQQREYFDYRNPPSGVDTNTLNLGDPVPGRPGWVFGYDIAGGGWFMTPQGSGTGQPFGGTPGEPGFPPGGGGTPGGGQTGPGGVPTSYGGLYAPPDSTTYSPQDWQFDPASYAASANFEGINPATYQSGEAYNYNLPTYNPYTLQYETPQGYQAGQLSQYQGWNPGAINQAQQQAVLAALGSPSMSAEGVSQLKERQKGGSLEMQKQLQQQLAQSAASRGVSGGGNQQAMERRLGENLANSVLSGNRDIDIEKMQTDRSDLLNALGVAEQYQQGSFGRDLQGQQQRLQTEMSQEDLRRAQAADAMQAAGLDLEADRLRADESYRGYGSQADAQRFQYEQAGRRDDERFRGYESQQEAARFRSDQAQRGADDRWRAYQAGQTGAEFNLDQQLAREGLRRDSSDSSFRSYQADIARLAQSEELRRLQEALGLQGELGRGGLDLQGRQLSESGRQFDQGHALNWAQLLQQGNQFSQSLGLDYADLLQRGNLGQLQAMLQGLS